MRSPGTQTIGSIMEAKLRPPPRAQNGYLRNRLIEELGTQPNAR